jgi:putative colanic acid biosynthesis acetyltransferase WcaF
MNVITPKLDEFSRPPRVATRVRNDLFDADQGADRGKPHWFEALWYFVKCIFFLNPTPWPASLKRGVLRLFGAEIGAGVNIKPRVNIHFPWKLTIGEHAWIGEEVFILNFEPVVIGAHTCISQRAFICTGNHNYASAEFSYRNAPITIRDGAWIGAQCFVAAGVCIGTEAVALAGSIVTRDLPDAMVCSGNPCVPTRHRWKE